MPRLTLPLFSALALAIIPVALGQSYTSTYGYTKVTVPAGDLAAVSASLKLPAEFTGDGVVNADYNAGAQTITVADANWGAGQWTGQAYIVYVCDSNGAEEAFLITSHTTTDLTISTSFDLQSTSRAIPDAPTTTSVSIHPARTLGNTFGDVGATDFENGDIVYLWDGSGWETYVFVNGWRKAGQGGTFENDIVYPDEGFFVKRINGTDLELTFLGTIPGKAQVATVPGPGSLMIASRLPVDTTLGALGLENLPGWQPGQDFVYLWDQTGWTTYVYISGWRKAGQGGTFENDPVPANSALFIKRSGAANPDDSALQIDLPYPAP